MVFTANQEVMWNGAKYMIHVANEDGTTYSLKNIGDGSIGAASVAESELTAVSSYGGRRRARRSRKMVRKAGRKSRRGRKSRSGSRRR